MSVSYSPVIIHRSVTVRPNQETQFAVIRHDYDTPIFVDEIRFAGWKPSGEVQMRLGRLPLIEGWTSPYAICRKLDPVEDGENSVDDDESGGILQWQLPKPMILMPNEELIIPVRSAADFGEATDYTFWLAVIGRPLPSTFQPPKYKDIPYVAGFKSRLMVVGDSAPQVEEIESIDSQLANATGDLLRLHRIGLHIMGTMGGVGGDQIYPPVDVTISDSEGAFILKDPASIYLLGNGGTRILDLFGMLRARHFWTLKAQVDLSPLAANGGGDTIWKLVAALVGTRTVPYVNLLQQSHKLYQSDKALKQLISPKHFPK